MFHYRCSSSDPWHFFQTEYPWTQFSCRHAPKREACTKWHDQSTSHWGACYWPEQPARPLLWGVRSRLKQYRVHTIQQNNNNNYITILEDSEHGWGESTLPCCFCTLTSTSSRFYFSHWPFARVLISWSHASSNSQTSCNHTRGSCMDQGAYVPQHIFVPVQTTRRGLHPNYRLMSQQSQLSMRTLEMRLQDL